MPEAMQANGLAAELPAIRTVDVDAFCSRHVGPGLISQWTKCIIGPPVSRSVHVQSKCRGSVACGMKVAWWVWLCNLLVAGM